MSELGVLAVALAQCKEERRLLAGHLANCLEDLEEALAYVPAYFVAKHRMRDRIDRYREAIRPAGMRAGVASGRRSGRWYLTTGGELVDESGRRIATLEPELPDSVVASLAAASLLPRLFDLAGTADQAEVKAGSAEPLHQKASRDAALDARDRVVAAFQDLREFWAWAHPTAPPVASEGCVCGGACGEDHLGTICGVKHGQLIRRQRGSEGLWLAGTPHSPATYHPPVVGSLDADGLCQRCAWLTSRRSGAQGDT